MLGDCRVNICNHDNSTRNFFKSQMRNSTDDHVTGGLAWQAAPCNREINIQNRKTSHQTFPKVFMFHVIPFHSQWIYTTCFIYIYIYIHRSICPNHSISATSEASRTTSRPGKKRAEMQQTLKKMAKSSSLRYDHAIGCQWMPLYAIICHWMRTWQLYGGGH